jgi:hypothetical protein
VEWPGGDCRPGADRVDPTPGIDEEAVAAFKAHPLLSPRAVPPGMVLQSVDVFDEEPEFESCAGVHLRYGSRGPQLRDGQLRYLSISLRPASCSESGMVLYSGPPGEAGPPEVVVVGPYRGELRRSDGPGRGGGPREPVRHLPGG